jgi:tRNA dimethylallyltransferase
VVEVDQVPPVLFLMGPTAGGKTQLAVGLRQYLPLDIVSVDSAMVYREMDIGTAKPPAEILAVAPHRLIDICDPAESYSAARFCHDARNEINSIHSSGRIPLLVGGTGLYFRSLERGLSELPAADQNIRQRLEQQAQKLGWEKMHARLAEVDPDAALRIHPNDPQRIQRALEVFELTGTTLTEHFSGKQTSGLPCRIIKIICSPADRDYLHMRIGQRFHEMLDRGLVAEVEKLYQREDLHPGLPAMRMVGYRQVWKYLAGQLAYQHMIEQAIAATRQLAKRQLTWLRRESGSQWFDSQQPNQIDNMLKYIKKNDKKTYKNYHIINR